MVRINRRSFAHWFATCALMTVVVSGHRVSCQVPPDHFVAQQQLMGRGASFVEREIKLGDDYLSGRGVVKDEKQAAYWYEKAAEAGNPWAQKQIGYFYEAGIGVSADPQRAVHWYQLAAAAGLPGAKTNLGVAYLWGTGVPPDIQMALVLFREAAGKGDGAAATYLGNLYYFGKGVPQDKTVGEHWYTVGARLHDPVAEFDLGTLYSVENHPHDFAKAARWLRKSMSSGYVPAIHSLGLLLIAHPELSKSDRESVSLFEKGSAYGQWRSSETLGLLCAEGKLVPADPAAAYYYLRLAVLQGGADAPNEQLNHVLQVLSARLGTEQVSRQDRAAQDWFQQHHERVESLLKGHAGDSPPGLAIAAPAAGIHAGQIIAAPPAS